MTIAFSPAHFQPLDANGSPYRNGRLRFRVPGTLTDIVVYKDAARTFPHEPVIRANNAGVFPAVFFADTTYVYDMEVRDVSGNVVYEIRNVAVPQANIAPSTAGGTAGVVRKVTSAPITPTEYETGYAEGVAATADVSLTLPPTSEVVGQESTFRHAGTARSVILIATSGDTIDGQNAYALTYPGASVRLRASNGRYRVVNESAKATHAWVVKSRTLTTPPLNAPAGDTYIAAATAVSPWVPNRIYVSTGLNTWQDFTPAEGWSAIVMDDLQQAMPSSWLFFNGAWERHLYKPTLALRIQAMTVAYEAPSGTAPVSAAANNWTNIPLNTTVSSTITGASLAGSRITLPVDRYYVHGIQSFLKTGKSLIRLKSANISTELRGPTIDATDNTSTDDGMESSFSGFFEVDTASPDVEFQYRVGTSGGTLGSVSANGSPERFGMVTFIRLTPQAA